MPVVTAVAFGAGMGFQQWYHGQGSAINPFLTSDSAVCEAPMGKYGGVPHISSSSQNIMMQIGYPGKEDSDVVVFHFLCFLT